MKASARVAREALLVSTARDSHPEEVGQNVGQRLSCSTNADPAAGNPAGVTAPVRTWQHDETGRITQTAECPGPRWVEVPAGVTVPAAPEPPPECKTEGEKRAFAFGWWKALEAQRNAGVKGADKC